MLRYLQTPLTPVLRSRTITSLPLLTIQTISITQRKNSTVKKTSTKKEEPSTISENTDDIRNVDKVELLQSTVDKLVRKQDALVKNVSVLREAVTIMSTSIQMLTENHVNQRVLLLLKTYKLIQESSFKSSPFVKVNSPPRVEDFVKSFVKDVEIPGAETAIAKTIHSQAFVSLDGLTLTYDDTSPTSSFWITKILNQARGGKKRSMLSGEVTVIGNLENIVKSLHRAMRYPILIRRYTNRLYQSLYKTDGHEGLEHITVFVVMGSIYTRIPSHFFNRPLAPNNITELENAILELFDGEVFIPEDEKILAWMDSNPATDVVGAWRALGVAEIDGKLATKVSKEGGLLEDSVKDYVQLLVLLRMAVLHRFDLFLGSIVNPLQ
jgi:hypothetical protein